MPAGLEANIPRQKALLRAACYGRAFCTGGLGGSSGGGYDTPSSSSSHQSHTPALSPYLMHDTTGKLRVLNALREPAVGLPLTMCQLEALTLPVVVARCGLLHAMGAPI